MSNQATEAETSTCTDIRGCRTLYSIVWTCLIMVFASTWVAVHPKVPAVESTSWERFSDRLLWLLVAVVAPDAIVLKAWDEHRSASFYASIARYDGWSLTHSFFMRMGGFYDSKWKEVQTSLRTITPENYPHIFEPISPYEHWPLSNRSETISSLFVSLTGWGSGQRVLQCSGVRINISVEEILDRSKNDWLGKGIIVLQTAWFLLHYGTRAYNRLPTTELEVMTLAYAILNFVTYGLWWHKPFDVGYPIELQTGATLRSRVSNLEPEHAYGFPMQDIGGFSRVPGEGIPIEEERGPKKIAIEKSPDLTPATVLMIIAFIAAFGAIHGIGWNFPFPSNIEKLIWRVCTATITGLPVFGGIIAFLAHLADLGKRLMGIIIKVTIPLYAIARILMIVVAFTSLRSLPPGAYQAVNWTSYIPHVG